MRRVAAALLLLSLGPGCDSTGTEGLLLDVYGGSGVSADAGVGSDAAPTDVALDTGSAPDGTAPDVPPKGTCTKDSDCDDGLDCTASVCDPKTASCLSTLKPGFCLVNNVCYADGANHPTHACRVCAAKDAPLTLTLRPTGTACDDGHACTTTDTCTATGDCAGVAVACDDQKPCTVDTCADDGSCTHAPGNDGLSCDDLAACTSNDRCVGGLCHGDGIVCDDQNPCTKDACGATGQCEFTPQTGSCEDGDACTKGDSCAKGQCVAGPADSCNDGNGCTIDFCTPQVGCGHLPVKSACCTGQVSVCDDGKPCTDDLCDPVTFACSHPDSTAACSDGNDCTVNDGCLAGACVGALKTCDDQNSCTNDACVKGVGCVNAAIGTGPCDDGLACSTGDHCNNGVCQADTSQCVCTPSFGDGMKVTALAIGVDGNAGNGLDVDQNPATCAPAGQCQSGIDNAFSALAGLANGALSDSVTKGSLIVLLELPASKAGTFALAVHTGKLAPSNPTCDVTKSTCDYVVAGSGFDKASCKALYTLPCTLVGNALSGGSKTSVIPFDVPLGQGAVLTVALYNARFDGTVVQTGDNVTSVSGVLGGAIRKTDLLTAIDAVPAEALPLPKDTIKGLLGSILTYDIDTDGDGAKDAASVGFPLSAIDAQLTGVSW